MTDLECLMGVVSVLEGERHRYVKRLWRMVEREHGWPQVRVFSHPHITFQGGRIDGLKPVGTRLRELAAEYLPVDIHVEGIGHFDRKTIYLKVERASRLVQLHEAVDDLLSGCCQWRYERYTVDHWIPHITVATGEPTGESFERAWSALAAMDIRFTGRLHNLCLVTSCPGGRFRIVRRYFARPGAPPDSGPQGGETCTWGE